MFKIKPDYLFYNNIQYKLQILNLIIINVLEFVKEEFSTLLIVNNSKLRHLILLGRNLHKEGLYL